MSCAQCDKVAAFFTILENVGADSWLPIPPYFAQLYGSNLGKEVTLYGPDDGKWMVAMWGPSLTSIGLRSGWGSFMAAYGLKTGDLVVMKLVETSTFKVDIFGGQSRVARHPEASFYFNQQVHAARNCDTSARKPVADYGQVTGQRVRSSRVQGRRVTEPEYSQTTKSPTVQTQKRGRPRKNSPEPGQNKPKRQRAPRRLTWEPPSPAMEKARQFTSRHPCYTVEMRDSHAVRVYYMGIASDFARRHLPAGETKMVLVDSNGNRYPAKWLGDRNPCGISAGWRGFARHLKIELHDVCVFELVDGNKCEPVFKVHIYKAEKDKEKEDKEAWKSTGMDLIIYDSEEGF